MRKEILRMCVVTKERLEKRELLRIVKSKDGEVLIDTTGKLNGKGAYIKKDKGILEKAKKSKALDKALNCAIPDNIYEEIEKYI